MKFQRQSKTPWMVVVGLAIGVVALTFYMVLLDRASRADPTRQTPSASPVGAGSRGSTDARDSTRQGDVGGSDDARVARIDADADDDSTAPPSAETPLGVAREGRGRAVDYRTWEPIPDLTLTDVEGGRPQRTDENGWFEHSGSHPAPAFFDLGERIEVADFETTPTVARLRIGPTLDIDFESTGIEARGSLARLVEYVRHDGVAGELEVVDDGELRLSQREGNLANRTWSWSPVRSGDVPWVRFPVVEFEPDDRYEVQLEVFSPTTGRVAKGAAIGTTGIQPAVQLEFVETRSWVEGRALDESGAGREGVHVVVIPSGSDPSSTLAEWDETTTDTSGHFAFRRASRGPMRIVCVAGPSVVATEVDVGPGVNRLTSLTIPTARSATVEYGFRERSPEPGRVYLLAEIPEFAPYLRRWIGTDGTDPQDRAWRLVGLKDAPPVDLQVRQIGVDGPPRFRPLAISIEPRFAMENAEWIAPEDRLLFEFECVDSATGSPINSEVRFGPDGNVLTQQTDEPRSWSLPSDVRLEWMVSSPGYAPKYGDESAFRPIEGRRLARVALDKGWGAGLYFRAGNPASLGAHPGVWHEWTFPAAASMLGLLAAPPVPGVEVRADGHPVGVSDPSGAVRLSMAGVPSVLTIVCRGWTVSGLSRVSWSELWARRYVVWLEPGN